MSKIYPNTKLPINKWSESNRPREKYIEKGFPALSDAELLAILLRSGNRTESAVDVGIRLLTINDDNLNKLAEMSVNELTAINGIGEVKAITIKAAFELGQRRRSASVLCQRKIKFVSDLVDLMQDKIAEIDYEEFWVVFLNQGSVILGVENFGKGGISSTSVDIRLIMKKAIEYSATGLLLCHNHPSGEVKPSQQDINLTHQIKNAAQYFNISLLDHLILHKNNYYSFHSEGVL